MIRGACQRLIWNEKTGKRRERQQKHSWQTRGKSLRFDLWKQPRSTLNRAASPCAPRCCTLTKFNAELHLFHAIVWNACADFADFSLSPNQRESGGNPTLPVISNSRWLLKSTNEVRGYCLFLIYWVCKPLFSFKGFDLFVTCLNQFRLDLLWRYMFLVFGGFKLQDITENTTVYG